MVKELEDVLALMGVDGALLLFRGESAAVKFKDLIDDEERECDNARCTCASMSARSFFESACCLVCSDSNLAYKAALV